MAVKARGAALGSCTTSDANGNYSLTVPVATGALWVEASGGTYIDETTAVSTTLPAGSTPRALVTVNGGSVVTMLTPLGAERAKALNGEAAKQRRILAARSCCFSAPFTEPCP